jgi:hypothetical protein
MTRLIWGLRRMFPAGASAAFVRLSMREFARDTSSENDRYPR